MIWLLYRLASIGLSVLSLGHHHEKYRAVHMQLHAHQILERRQDNHPLRVVLSTCLCTPVTGGAENVLRAVPSSLILGSGHTLCDSECEACGFLEVHMVVAWRQCRQPLNYSAMYWFGLRGGHRVRQNAPWFTGMIANLQVKGQVFSYISDFGDLCFCNRIARNPVSGPQEDIYKTGLSKWQGGFLSLCRKTRIHLVWIYSPSGIYCRQESQPQPASAKLSAQPLEKKVSS